MTFDDAVLPEELRGPRTKVSRIAAGLSGAGVYRVEVGERRYVLKVASASEGLEGWRRSVEIQQRAGEAGLAPRVVHHDEERRAVVSEYVENRGFAGQLFAPQTRAGSIQRLGEMIARVHALPLAGETSWRDPREVIRAMQAATAGFAVPGFVRAAIDAVMVEVPPERERALVTSHNDMNPSNLVFDGERLMLLDWNMAGPNDPYYDLATVALFLRMDDASVRALLAAHDGVVSVTELPARFVYLRRLVAALCASIFLQLAQQAGHAGGDVEREMAPTLGDVHGMIGVGAITPGSAEGAWLFAQALIRTIVDAEA